jgi:FkbM family methyltransferase
MKKLFNAILKKAGYQIKKFPDHYLVRRIKIVNHYRIDTLFDIGANSGQYSLEMRRIGYRKRIISFEPQRRAYEKLKKAASGDDRWIVNNYALGSEDIKGTLYVSANSWSSSLLNVLPLHLTNAPESEFISREETEIRKLDSIFNSFFREGDNVMLKIDTQGYEKRILDGAEKSLDKIRIIQVEMSLAALYESETLFLEMINLLDKKGFQLLALEDTGMSDKATGRLLEIDGLFINNSGLI